MIKYFKDKIRKRRARKLKCLLGGIHTYKYTKYGRIVCIACGSSQRLPQLFDISSAPQISPAQYLSNYTEFGKNVNKTKTK